MLTIDPPPALVIGSITAFIPSQQPTALTSSTRRKSATGMSAIGANCKTPALFTSTSSLPKTSTARATAAAQSSSLVTSWWSVPAGLLAEPGRHGRAPVVQHVAEHHLGALGDEVPHVRLAHAPGAAGDQRDLAVEPAHGPSPIQRFRDQTLAWPEPTSSRPKLERVIVLPRTGPGGSAPGGPARAGPDAGGPDGSERGLHRGRSRQRGLRAGQAPGRNRRQRHPAGGGRPGPHQAGAPAGDDRHLPQRARAEEAPGLGVLHRPAGQRARPPDPAAPGPGARRLRLDQRHGVRPREPPELRRLGRGGLRRLELQRRAAQLQALRGLGGRRHRAARFRRPGEGDQAEGPDPRLAGVHRGPGRDRRGQEDRRLQRRGPGRRGGLPAERQRRPALQHVDRLPGRARPAQPHRDHNRPHHQGA